MTGGITHTGWKAIAKRLGVKDVRTARKWAKKCKVPIIIMGRTPTLDESIYTLWCRENIIIKASMKNDVKMSQQ